MIRNLIYHITPLADWRWNLELLKKHIAQFNGAKIAFVAQGAGVEPLTEIIPELACFDTIWPIDNDPELRETPSLFRGLTLLPRYADKDEGITFFAHTKGVTRVGHPAVKLWTETMYEKNLSDLYQVSTMIRSYPVLGCFKRYGEFPVLPDGNSWHYSGAFYWFDNKALYARDWKAAIKPHRYGAEAFPGFLYSELEGGCLFADDCLGRPGLGRFESPYNLNHMLKLCGVRA